MVHKRNKLSANYRHKGNILLLAGLLLIVCIANSFAAAYDVVSPNGKIKAVVEDGVQLYLSLKVNGKIILDKQSLGLKTEEEEFGKNATAQSYEYFQADSGKRNPIDITKAGTIIYNLLSLHFKCFDVDVRVCDESVTCRFTASLGKKMVVEDEIFYLSSSMNNKSKVTRIKLDQENVIVRGIRPEEQLWGAYQFPRPYNLGDRLVVAVHVTNDNIESFGETNRWFESRDKGMTWKETDPSVATECGLLLQNGDRLYFPMESGIRLDNYKMTPQHFYTPDYDFTKKAEEGILPIPDGVTFWGGTTIRAYNADRLPASLSEKVWLAMRTPEGQKDPVKEYVKVDWPYLTRVVHTTLRNNRSVLKPIFPRGNLKTGTDGAIWVSVFSGEGHINPENGQYSPYYSAELFRSEDFGHSFQRRAHMEYEADGHKYPYLSGGFSDSDFEFMPDSSLVWFFRSNWYMNTGTEWAPMYMSRSTDEGINWSKPARFSDLGTLPRLCKLKNDITLLCYARPGMFVTVCENESGTRWSQPLVLMDPGDRSHLHNVKIDAPSFHEWDGTGGNPELIPLDENSALLFYSDFYYSDEKGIKRKTILCRKITVEREIRNQ